MYNHAHRKYTPTAAHMTEKVWVSFILFGLGWVLHFITMKAEQSLFSTVDLSGPVVWSLPYGRSFVLHALSVNHKRLEHEHQLSKGSTTHEKYPS